MAAFGASGKGGGKLLRNTGQAVLEIEERTAESFCGTFKNFK